MHHCFYLIALSIVLLATAKYLWKVEQVIALAILLSGVLSLILGFAYAPTWEKLVLTTLAAAICYFYPGAKKVSLAPQRYQ